MKKIIWLQIYKDGNQYCAVYSDFVDLAESLAGFGNTALEAITDLLKQSPIEL